MLCANVSIAVELFPAFLGDTTDMNRSLAETAALLSDPGRAAMLTALLGGMTLPAGELALIANVAPQTASSHLSKMVEGRLLSVEQQGRHRYYRLINAEVAHAIEALLAIVPNDAAGTTSEPRKKPGDIAYARSCYSHLAGQLAVQLADFLQARRMLAPREQKLYHVTASGRAWLEEFGIPIRDRDLKDEKFARRCLDWTERRHHVAGRLGSAMLARFRELKWIAPIRNSRAVRVTVDGQRRISELLRAR